jgi:hemerythrin-like domain-containing protein
MKRAPELRDLSDHHHQGLVHARQLRRAATDEEVPPLEETSEAFLEFWQGGTTAHFREEEEVLLPILARYGGEVGSEPVMEMLAQHAQIRGLVMELSDEFRNKAIMPETLQSIGELLETHIRLEEREVFPMIEEVLAEEGLKEVADRLKVREARPQAEPWIPNEGLSYEPWPGPGDSEGGGYEWPVSPV